MNLKLFPSSSRRVPAADTRNDAGGLAYASGPQLTLAQYAATGCLNGTFYAGAETQLETLLKMASACDAAFVAKTAVFARQRGFMKDVPALSLKSSLPSPTAPCRPTTGSVSSTGCHFEVVIVGVPPSGGIRVPKTADSPIPPEGGTPTAPPTARECVRDCIPIQQTGFLRFPRHDPQLQPRRRKVRRRASPSSIILRAECLP